MYMFVQYFMEQHWYTFHGSISNGIDLMKLSTYTSIHSPHIIVKLFHHAVINYLYIFYTYTLKARDIHISSFRRVSSSDSVVDCVPTCLNNGEVQFH